MRARPVRTLGPYPVLAHLVDCSPGSPELAHLALLRLEIGSQLGHDDLVLMPSWVGVSVRSGPLVNSGTEEATSLLLCQRASIKATGRSMRGRDSGQATKLRCNEP